MTIFNVPLPTLPFPRSNLLTFLLCFDVLWQELPNGRKNSWLKSFCCGKPARLRAGCGGHCSWALFHCSLSPSGHSPGARCAATPAHEGQLLKTPLAFPGPSSKQTSVFVIVTCCCIGTIALLVLWFIVFLLLHLCTTTALLHGLAQQLWCCCARPC